MILKGDCIEVMKALKPNSVDAIVCDPPYGLEFMGKEWDKLRNTWQAEKGRYHNDTTFLAKGDRIRYQAGLEMQLWHTQWLTEAYRVLKPGGSMLVMGGTRTFHRLMCAIEDSGFIIKDTLMWMYGSGFPKAQDLGKIIDKRTGVEREILGERMRPDGTARPNAHNWSQKGMNEGWQRPWRDDPEKAKMNHLETAPSTSLAKHWNGFKVGGIKPAYEPIVWAVKPPEGSYVDNILKHGVGAVNVDECRVGVESDDDNKRKATGKMGGSDSCFGVGNKHRPETLSKGRFPANIILSHHPECVQVGVKKVKSSINHHESKKSIWESGKERTGHDYADSNGLETVESWNCHPDCPVRILDEQSGESISRGGMPKNLGNDRLPWRGSICETTGGLGDSGGASRFFYCAKASRNERNEGLESKNEPIVKHGARPCDWEKADWFKRNTNSHPTVKPIKLFEWLVRLVTREGQIILDPFLGSGTTAIAAHNAGRKCVGIEKEEEYLGIAKKRIDYWEGQPKQMELI